jgi:monothiol glutaredoxin
MRKVLDKVDSPALTAIQKFHSEVIQEVEAAVQKNKIVVVGMSMNPFVGKAKKVLADSGKEFKYIEYGGYFSQWKPRLAVKLWSGWPTFPQVFVDGKLIGGFQETSTWLKQSSK